MIEAVKHINYFLQQIGSNRCILTSHISLYIAMIRIQELQGYKNPFRITRRELMRTSAIRSFATFHKCLQELIGWGYIAYRPSYCTYKASQITFLFRSMEPVSNVTVEQLSG
jgi:hypothetical protein